MPYDTHANSHATQDIYADPMVYDVLHSPGTAKEVDGLIRLAGRFVKGPVRRVLEPACGTGRYLRFFAARGFDVVGMDLSEAMAEYAEPRVRKAGQRARGRQPKVEISAGDMCDMRTVETASVDFAFNMINTVRHLQNDEQLRRHLNEVARAMRPGAVYAVGISLSVYGFEGVSEDVWGGKRGGMSVHQVITYFPPKGATAGRERYRGEAVHSHLTILRSGKESHIDSRYELRSYSQAQWDAAILSSGLRTRAIVDEVGEDLAYSPPGYAIYVLGHAGRGE
jgi:SAM-dependent methyltransferase